MAVTFRALGFGAACALLPAVAAAQVESRLTTDVDFTAGHSTDGVNAAAVQVRAFGATSSDWRYFVEAAWGRVTASPSDAFGAAYPYDRHVRAMEAYVEKTAHQERWILGLRAGRYRTPFGISGRADHAYAGFVRAPLIRYGRNWTISNTFLDTGVSVMAGLPQASVEASIGAPLDEGEMRRTGGATVTVRGQAYYRAFVLGMSTLRSRPNDDEPWVTGSMVFHGVDGRWMRGGVQVRGEWIWGQPFDDVTTRGGYLDAIVHHVRMGPVTAVARAERLDYDAGEHSAYLRRYTAGARVRITRAIAAQINVLHQPLPMEDQRRTALDVSVTYSVRF
jgi:hypothetical protein